MTDPRFTVTARPSASGMVEVAVPSATMTPSEASRLAAAILDAAAAAAGLAPAPPYRLPDFVGSPPAGDTAHALAVSTAAAIMRRPLEPAEPAAPYRHGPRRAVADPAPTLGEARAAADRQEADRATLQSHVARAARTRAEVHAAAIITAFHDCAAHDVLTRGFKGRHIA